MHHPSGSRLRVSSLLVSKFQLGDGCLIGFWKYTLAAFAVNLNGLITDFIRETRGNLVWPIRFKMGLASYSEQVVFR